jgi:hypothetical protein
MAEHDKLGLEEAARAGDEHRFVEIWENGGRGYVANKEYPERLRKFVEYGAEGGSRAVARLLVALKPDASALSFGMISAILAGQQGFAEELASVYGEGADSALLSYAVMCRGSEAIVRSLVSRAVARGLPEADDPDGPLGPLGLPGILSALQNSIRMGHLENAMALAEVAGDRFEPADWGRAATLAKRSGGVGHGLYAFLAGRAKACKERSAMERHVSSADGGVAKSSAKSL